MSNFNFLKDKFSIFVYTCQGSLVYSFYCKYHKTFKYRLEKIPAHSVSQGLFCEHENGIKLGSEEIARSLISHTDAGSE